MTAHQVPHWCSLLRASCARQLCIVSSLLKERSKVDRQAQPESASAATAQGRCRQTCCGLVMPLRQPWRCVIGSVQPKAILQALRVDPPEFVHLAGRVRAVRVIVEPFRSVTSSPAAHIYSRTCAQGMALLRLCHRITRFSALPRPALTTARILRAPFGPWRRRMRTWA